MRIREGRPTDWDRLVEIWETSVRATHAFLSESDIVALRPEVREAALPALELWVLCDDDDAPLGFMGLDSAKVEALFIAAASSRRGGGRMLIEHARRLKGPLTVDVNEQNPAALRFYEAMGFRVEGRSAVDSAGRPFPLLHLAD